MRRGILTLARVSPPAWRSECVTAFFEIPLFLEFAVRGFAHPDALVPAASMPPAGDPSRTSRHMPNRRSAHDDDS